MAAALRKSSDQDMQLLRKDIENKSFRRVYLLYGDEPYLVRQYRHLLSEAVTDPDDTMNINIHRSSVPDLGQLQDEMMTMPFFSQRRLVVLENTGLFQPSKGRKGSLSAQPENGADEEAASTAGNTEDDSTAGMNPDSTEDAKESENAAGISDTAGHLSALLSNIPDTTVVIFSEQPDEKRTGGRKTRVSVDRRGKLYRAVVKNGLAIEFAQRSSQDIGKWTALRLQKEKIRITQGALNHFLELAGTDMYHVSSELEKLISYAGAGGTVRIEDVDAIVSRPLEGNVFRLIDLISKRDCKGALELYDDLIQLREAPVMILVLIMRQFDQMATAKSLVPSGGIPAVMSSLKKADWQARQLINQAGHFTSDQLRKAVEECADTQQTAQSGVIGMETGVELLIVKLCMV